MDSKDLSVFLNIAMTLKAIEQAFRKSIAELQIELPTESFGILMITYFHQGVIQQDIAELAKKDKSAVLRQIDMLEAKGLVMRQTDEHDRRKNLIIITDKGKEIAQALVRKEQELLLSLSQDIDIKEMETFSKVLAALKNNAKKV
jgi:DNA-binding MarR family transcriptional regulator